MILKHSWLYTFKFIIFLYFFVGFFNNAFAHPFEHPTTWKDQKITEMLKNSKVTTMEPMKKFLLENGKKTDFEGEVFLVTLDNGVRAVFKSLPLDDLGDAQAEVAAYRASIVLGFPYVPPTIMREINGMKGSLQLFVNTPIDTLAFGAYQKALKEATQEDNANLRIFYFIFGQWDSGAHNLLVYQDQLKTYLIAIDNSGIRNHQHVKFGDLPFVRILYSDKLNTNDWDKPFPFDQAKVIEEPTPENLRQVFKDKVPNLFYKNFKAYNHPLNYVIYRNSLWLQYHAFDKDFIKAYPNSCFQSTQDMIKKLDLRMLKNIFSAAKGADFLTEVYLNAILMRRDMIAEFCNHKGRKLAS